MTLKARVIPCLDVKDGRVVKGVNFVDLIDAGDPVEAAKAYDAAGADELCFLDITASSDNRDTIFEVVAQTADQCFMPLTVGGGVRTIADIRKLLLCGADKVAINSAAVNNPDFIAEAADKFGDQCIVVSIDAKQRRKQEAGGDNVSAWEIYTHGGRTPTGIDAVEFARKMVERGAGELLVTSMDRDGTKIGYDLELTRTIADACGYRSSPLAGSARSTIWSPASGTDTRPRCLPRRSSTSAPIRSPRPSSIWPGTASPCGSTERPRKGSVMSDFSLTDLERIVADRARARPDESWTAKLVAGGQSKAAKKLGEEDCRNGDRGDQGRSRKPRLRECRPALSPDGRIENRRHPA